MSSSDSTVTYTSVSSEDVPFWVIRFFGMEQPDSPKATPQSPIQTPPVPHDEDEREPMFIQPHDPDYEQPLPPVVSPTAESPEYAADSDPEEDPEEYKDEETKDGPVNYPIDGGDDGDDYDVDSSGDDADDEEEDEEEEEEHLASADSAIIIPTDELVSPPEGKEFVEVERLLAMPTPSPSLLTSLLPPSARERWLGVRPQLHVHHHHLCHHHYYHHLGVQPKSRHPTQIQTPRLASTHALIDAVTAAIPLPPLPPPLYIPPTVDRRDDIPEIEMPPHKRLCLSTLGSRYEIRESSTAWLIGDRGIDYGFVSTLDAEARRRGIGEVGYGIRDIGVDPAETVPEITPMTVREVSTRVTELAELHEDDIQDLYALLKDAQDSRTRISQ
nr:hypothetical protein [Tanacetum cinerariifolium]